MTQFESDGSTVIEGMGAPPQDYLEKIFQIPFTVRPMGQQGFARLMQRLLVPSVGQPTAAPPQSEEVNTREAAGASTADPPTPEAPPPESADVVTPTSAAQPDLLRGATSVTATPGSVELECTRGSAGDLAR